MGLDPRPTRPPARVPGASGTQAPPGGSENEVRGIGLFVVMSRIPETEPGLLPVKYMFQCPPLDRFTKAAAYNHVDFDTVRWGQYSRQGGVQLRTIQFDTLVLDYKPSWTNISPDSENYNPRQDGGGWQPNIHAMCDELESICRSGTPFHLRAYQPSMWGQKSELEWDATLRTLNIEQRAGEPETRYITAAFTEWRKIGTNEKGRSPTGTSPAGKTVGTSRALNQAGGNKGQAKGSVSQWVSASDLGPNARTLYDLAKQAYGTTVLWTAISQANPKLAALPPSADIPESLSQDMKILLPKVR